MASLNGEKIVSFIDIGTNSVRLLVVRLNPNCSYTIISQEKEVVRLGENEFEDYILKENAMNRTSLVCKKFAELSRTYGATEIFAVATSAVREASNKEEFLAMVKQDAGIDIRVISGSEEARYIFLGLSSGVHIGSQEAAFIDVGGGSTEVVIGDQDTIRFMESYKYGAIRCTKWFSKGTDRPVAGQDYERVKERISSGMGGLPSYSAERPLLAFGSSGTIINLAEIAAKNFKGGNGEWELTIGRKKLRKVRSLVCSLSLDERRHIPGINPERADIIIGGMAVVEALMERLALKEIIASNRSLRDGLLADYLIRIWGDKITIDLPVRERSILQLARSCNHDEGHARSVCSLAMQLFDTSREIGLHDMGDRERELLRYAALLHDIGDFISFNDHHLHSHYIITHADLPGFNKQDVRIIANIARYHRKKPPNKRAMDLEGLNQDSRETVLGLFPFLRVAENLDRSHRGLVKACALGKGDSPKITLSLWSECDCQLEDWSVRNSVMLLEKSLGRALELAWHRR